MRVGRNPSPPEVSWKLKCEMRKWIKSRNNNGAVVVVSVLSSLHILFACIEPQNRGVMWTQFYVCNKTRLNKLNQIIVFVSIRNDILSKM